MPSIRVKKSRAPYALLGEDFYDPSHASARHRALSASEGLSNQSSPPHEQATTNLGRRARASTYTGYASNQPYSRVSTHITNDSTWRSRDTLLLDYGTRRFSSLGDGYNNSSLSNRRPEGVRSHSEGQHKPEGALRKTLSHSDQYQDDPEHHDEAVVDHLDVIDPQVSTVSNLTNAAHSILIPSLSINWWKPAIFLPKARLRTSSSEKGRISGQDSKDELDEHVEDVLSNKDKLRRTLKGIGSFLKTPLGIITAIYGFLVAFWGAAIVFFLAKFINLHNADRQGFWVEVTSQVVNGLFTVTGVGLIPLRVSDTYRIYKIWHYKRRTRTLRENAGLPALLDEDDLPDPYYDPNYVHVLTDKEQQDLRYQQYQFMKSQSWYRPHATNTHRAFPINTALLICCSIDFNSIFQIILCGTMWGLDRFDRPPWSTGILIPASFLCGILAGVLIWRGGQKTKLTAKVEERLRMALSMGASPQPTSGTPDFRRTNTEH